MTGGGIDSKQLQDLRRKLFGVFTEHSPMPTAYLSELQRLVERATATVGVPVSATERHAYWLDGRSLGKLSSTGITEEDAEISGCLLQLDHVTGVEISVKVAKGGPWGDDTTWGRIVALRSRECEIVLDATPGDYEQRVRVDKFISAVLAALAGRR